MIVKFRIYGRRLVNAFTPLWPILRDFTQCVQSLVTVMVPTPTTISTSFTCKSQPPQSTWIHYHINRYITIAYYCVSSHTAVLKFKAEISCCNQLPRCHSIQTLLLHILTNRHFVFRLSVYLYEQDREDFWVSLKS